MFTWYRFLLILSFSAALFASEHSPRVTPVVPDGVDLVTPSIDVGIDGAVTEEAGNSLQHLLQRFNEVENQIKFTHAQIGYTRAAMGGREYDKTAHAMVSRPQTIAAQRAYARSMEELLGTLRDLELDRSGVVQQLEESRAQQYQAFQAMVKGDFFALDHKAATEIQKNIRGFLTRKSIQEQDEAEKAAVVMQAAVRGFRARNLYREMQRKAAEKAEEDAARLEREVQSAAAIQAQVRGFQARRIYVAMQERAQKDQAAIAVQAVVRGRQARTLVDKMKIQAEAEAEAARQKAARDAARKKAKRERYKARKKEKREDAKALKKAQAEAEEHRAAWDEVQGDKVDHAAVIKAAQGIFTRKRDDLKKKLRAKMSATRRRGKGKGYPRVSASAKLLTDDSSVDTYSEKEMLKDLTAALPKGAMDDLDAVMGDAEFELNVETVFKVMIHGTKVNGLDLKAIPDGEIDDAVDIIIEGVKAFASCDPTGDFRSFLQNADNKAQLKERLVGYITTLKADGEEHA